MTELRERVAGATIFAKLDLKDGHHLIRIKKEGNGKPLSASNTDITNIY